MRIAAVQRFHQERIWRDKSERQLIENRYSPYVPLATGRVWRTNVANAARADIAECPKRSISASYRQQSTIDSQPCRTAQLHRRSMLTYGTTVARRVTVQLRARLLVIENTQNLNRLHNCPKASLSLPNGQDVRDTETSNGLKPPEV